MWNDIQKIHEVLGTAEQGANSLKESRDLKWTDSNNKGASDMKMDYKVPPYPTSQAETVQISRGTNSRRMPSHKSLRSF